MTDYINNRGAMKTIVTNLPNNRIYEYKIVLYPHAELWKTISELRVAVSKELELIYTIGSVHLVLGVFIQVEAMEKRIVDHLHKTALNYSPFKVELNDFGSYAPHLIFINVISKVPIQDLVKKIRSGDQHLMELNNENKPYFDIEPHITVARKLLPWQYEKAWLQFSKKHFNGSFIADRMLLLKRQVIPDQTSWQVVRHFDFLDFVSLVNQGKFLLN